MDYECDLRRLFRPPIDHLSSTEQLCRFRQRDMVPSHLYRLGLRLFTEKDKVCRRRVTTLEEGDLEIKQVYPGKRYSYANTAHKETNDDSNDDIYDDFKLMRYKKLLAERTALRTSLNGLGTTRRWLLSKTRTPLEESQLAKLINPQEKDIEIDSSELGLIRHIDKCKKEEIEKFNALMLYLDRNAFQYPSDQSIEDMVFLMQPRALLSSKLHKMDKSKAVKNKSKANQYKGFQGHKKPQLLKLVTGNSKVEAKVNTWLTHQQHLQLMMGSHALRTSVSGSTHRLGSPLDKVRLWMPMPPDKAIRSHHSIFMSLQQDRYYLSKNEQRLAWPENDTGRVQFGSATRKQYQI